MLSIYYEIELENDLYDNNYFVDFRSYYFCSFS